MRQKAPKDLTAVCLTVKYCHKWETEKPQDCTVDPYISLEIRGGGGGGVLGSITMATGVHVE